MLFLKKDVNSKKQYKSGVNIILRSESQFQSQSMSVISDNARFANLPS